VISVKLPVIPDEKDQKWKILGEIVNKLETRETKKALARYKITPVNKAVIFLKIIVLALFFSLEISYAVGEVNNRYELRKFLRIDERIKLRSIYNFMSKFEAEQLSNSSLQFLTLMQRKEERSPQF